MRWTYKFVGSLRKVISSDFKNLFIPVNRPSGVLAYDSTAGRPSNTITRSARYVAMIYYQFEKTLRDQEGGTYEIVLDNESGPL